MEYTLFYLTKDLPIYFRADQVGLLFFTVETVLWLAAGIFSLDYMKQEKHKARYYGAYFLVYGVLQGLNFAGNMITFYLFYELMTLLSVPLVLHHQTKEALMAGLKYLLYSVFGSSLILFGFFLLASYGNGLTFQAAGILAGQVPGEKEALVLSASFCMILGFSVKAGMFPFHGWLPTAHPEAPAPASAVLSAVIVKMGILGIIRTVYYVVGADVLRGTWVQIIWLILALITVFMGSVLAYRERLLKKRLAYSTVSQAAYILFGLALMNGQALTGALLHIVCHALFKGTLFLFAGALIHQTGKQRVDELKGIGKQMPAALWCFTLASLGLVGIPPTVGFLSKWYLAAGALESKILPFSWLGPAVLLISALFTAGYLLPISIEGFLPGDRFWEKRKKEPAWLMLFPILTLAFVSLLMGIFPGIITDQLIQIVGTIF